MNGDRQDIGSHASFGGAAGFTLVEVLIALAIVALMLTSIGGLIATTVRGARSIDQRMALIGSARTLWAGLPSRALLQPGTQRGAISDVRWQLNVAEFPATSVQRFGDPIDRKASHRWVPVAISMIVQGRGGRTLQLSTVRLQKRAGG